MRQRVLTRVFTELVDEALDKVSYDASVAGSGYAIACDAEGFELSVDGYTNVKLEAFIFRILDVVKTVRRYLVLVI